MDEQTRKLLEECSKGCKMAVGSMDQIQEHIQNEKLRKLVGLYKKKHTQLEEEAAGLLAKGGNADPDASVMASAMSWITTNVKLMMEETRSQAAKLLMDGCNMGIQSIAQARHKYREASSQSRSLADRLVKTEEQFAAELKEYL